MKKLSALTLAGFFVFYVALEYSVAQRFGHGGPGREIRRGGVNRVPNPSMRRHAPAQRPGNRPQVQQLRRIPKHRPAYSGPSRARIHRGKVPNRSELRRFLDLPPQAQGTGVRPKLNDRSAVPPRSPVKDRPAAAKHREFATHAKRHAFTPQWWKNHPNAAKAYWNRFHHRPHHPYHWWKPAAWGAVTGFIVGAAWPNPVVYDYGENIYFEGNTVYVDGQPAATAEEYYDQASAIASADVSAGQAEEGDWMPLGVYSLSDEQDPNSEMILQLAVNKEGYLSGTYYDTVSDTVRPVTGSVDKQSQRAAWRFADDHGADIVMETGLYNLTQDRTKALVHLDKETTQTWWMVRMKEPTGSS